MPAKILSAEKHFDGYRVKVHLDDSQVDEETGEPTAQYLREWTWGLPQPSQKPLHENGGHAENGEFHHAAHTQHGRDITEEEYVASILAMLPEMIERELHTINATRPGTPETVAALHGLVIGEEA